MVKSGKSIYLDSRLWIELEEFARKNGFDDISSAIEALLKDALAKVKK
ncbi:MAG: hypothetical protein RMJ17_01865 [Candidatus Aenigmarchaeota archaeon]|nr:hypothetical protein [Candidatus Aenigmarchaeota archaeon]MDW8149322.1 hypothetical protein [Candidatus Aenigmarchaeota archaeon]